MKSPDCAPALAKFTAILPQMWFLWSLRQLPSFGPTYWAPYLAAVLMYLLFEGQGGLVLGVEMFALKTAVIGMWCLRAAIGAGTARAADGPTRRLQRLTAQIMLCFVVVLVFLPNERVLMLTVTSFFAVAPLLFPCIPLMFAPEERKQLPYRWLRREETFAAGYALLCVRDGLYLIVAFWAIGALTVFDWLLWITAGRILLYFFYEWLMVLFWAARRS